MKRLVTIVSILLLATTVSLGQLTSIYGLNEYYNINNWTQVPGTGSIDITGAPINIVFLSGDSYIADDTYIHIAAMTDGTVSFDWTYTTPDGSIWDYPCYYINGTRHTFSSYNISGALVQSGTETFTVSEGDDFGFGVYTVDGMGGSCTVDAFSFALPSPAVPIGMTSVIIIFILAGVAIYVRSRKKLVKA